MLDIDKIKKIKFEDVQHITSEQYFAEDEYASAMFDTKYCCKFDERGEPVTKSDADYAYVETPAQVFMRIASGLAKYEDDKVVREDLIQAWFGLMWDGWFRPGGSIMSGIGAPVKKSTVNCTTLPLLEDTLESISKCDYEIMKCAAFRQGLGFDASALRPRGAPVNNAAEESTGVVPWIMKLVDNGKWVGQKGRMPALLVSLKDRHPDIVEFITSKMEAGKIENANISVQISNKFMEAVKKDETWELYFEFKNDRYERVSKVINARELFDLIAEAAYKCLHKDTELPVIVEGKLKLIKLSTLEKDYANTTYKAISLNSKEVKLTTNTIKCVKKHKNYEKMLKLYTSKGIVQLTDNHPLPVYDSNLNLKYTNAGGLVRGDKVIHLYNKHCSQNKVSMDNWHIFASEKYTTYDSDVHDFLTTIGTSDQTVCVYKNNKKCSLKYLSDNGYRKEIRKINFCNNKRREVLDFPINIGKHLSFFAGLLVADGNIHNNYIRISCNSNEVVLIKEYINKARKEIGLNSKITVKIEYESTNSATVLIYDSVFTLILKELCYKNKYKLVTDYFVRGTITNATAFMSGLCFGDRTLAKSNNIVLCVYDETRFNTITKLLTLHCLPYNVSYSFVKNNPKFIKGKLAKNEKNCFRIFLYDSSLDTSLLLGTRLEADLKTYTYRVPINYKFKIKTINENAVAHHITRDLTDLYEKIVPKLYKNNYIDSATILKVEELDYNDYVYDITVANDHNFIVSCGLLLKNCSEPGVQFIDLLREGSMVHQVYKETGDYRFKIISSNACSEKPLPPYGVCNLLSINNEMFSTEKEEYEKELKFLVPFLVRLSDNVVSHELSAGLSPLEDQAWVLEQTREIGLGITNIHGWLLKQDLAYDSDEAIETAESFFKTYACEVFKASTDLAKEKGSAPAWDLVKDKEVFMKSSYFKNIVDEIFNGDYTKITHMRNMAHMSIAPTGSLSNTFPSPCFSYGVEPVIGPYHWRRTRAIDKGTYTHYFVVPERVKRYVLSKLDKDSLDYRELSSFPGSVLDNDGVVGLKIKDIIEKTLPKGFFKQAHAIDVKKKIKLMSRLYKWIDAAISCTYNLPSSAKKEDVKEIYLRAFEEGVRAVSVYVEGSREGILIFDDPKTNEAKFKKKNTCDESDRPMAIMPNCAPKRPKEMPCDIIQTSIKGDMWTVLIGLLDGKPYEIFCGSTEDLYLPKSCKSGIVRKQGGGRYELEVMIRRSPVVYKDLASILMDDDQKAMTRLLSLSLRHGALPRYIVEQLKKSNGNITAFSTAISRVLSRYVGAYDLKKGENKCPQCGEEALVFVEGCIKCVNCTYSRCG